MATIHLRAFQSQLLGQEQGRKAAAGLSVGRQGQEHQAGLSGDQWDQQEAADLSAGRPGQEAVEGLEVGRQHQRQAPAGQAMRCFLNWQVRPQARDHQQVWQGQVQRRQRCLQEREHPLSAPLSVDRLRKAAAGLSVGCRGQEHQAGPSGDQWDLQEAADLLAGHPGREAAEGLEVGRQHQRQAPAGQATHCSPLRQRRMRLLTDQKS